VILHRDVILNPEFVLSVLAHENDDIAVQCDGPDGFAHGVQLFAAKE
jgi:hypothetical protein